MPDSLHRVNPPFDEGTRARQSFAQRQDLRQLLRAALFGIDLALDAPLPPLGLEIDVFLRPGAVLQVFGHAHLNAFPNVACR
jgi:hypothetical protein